MTERRCEACEAIITEIECEDCLILLRAIQEEQKIRALMIRPLKNIRTHCKHGHEMTEENTRIDIKTKPGKQSVTRACRTCHSERCREHRLRAKTNG